MTPLHTVRWSGGRMDGAVVRCPAELAEKLPGMNLIVSPSRRLYDLGAKRVVRGVEIVELPTERRPKPMLPTQRSRRRPATHPVFSGR